jgi:hypothetical protein
MRRKLSREGGNYSVAVRKGPKNPHVITVEDIFGKSEVFGKNGG